MSISKGISGSTLKIIAIISMLIDHTAAVILEAVMQSSSKENARILLAYYIMRGIGRIAFPIFCFLLIEGFKHTRSWVKYALRLFVFALISEIPFNLAFRGKFFASEYQNVFFTLLIGLLVIQGLRTIKEKAESKENLSNASTYFAGFIVIFVGMVIAELLLKTDYGGFGVLTIAIMYIFRESPVKSMLGGCITLTIMSYVEVVTFLNLPLIKVYNGKRGLSLKYIFYLFYPVHLVVLYFISYFFIL